MSSERTRLMLVEDDALLARQMVDLFGGADDLEVLGAFGTGEEALACRLGCDLAVVDLGLPDMNGADLIRALKAARPSLDVMAHTVYEDRKVVFEAIVAGASSYVLKGIGADALLAAIRELRAGGSPMSPRIARSVVAAFQRQGTVADQYTLTGRERQVLTHLEEGMTYKEVASALSVSPHTVHTHIKRIYEKLHASNKREALTKARLRGIL